MPHKIVMILLHFSIELLALHAHGYRADMANNSIKNLHAFYFLIYAVFGQNIKDIHLLHKLEVIIIQL